MSPPRVRVLSFVADSALAVALSLSAFALGTRSPLAGTFPVYTAAFLVLVPLAAGYLAVSPVAEPSPGGALLAAWIAVALALAVCRWADWEGTLYIAVALPWWVAASASGSWLARRTPPRRRVPAAVALAATPSLVVPLEQRLPLPSPARSSFQTATSVDVVARPNDLWEQVANIDSIGASELRPPVYVRFGVPTPVAALLERPRRGATRVATFGTHLAIRESITEWMDGERLRFRIAPNAFGVQPGSHSHQDILDGDHFALLGATYDLVPIGDSATRLTVTSRYRVATHFNWYSTRWAEQLARRMQRDILGVIKRRSEDARRSARPIFTADMRDLESALLERASALTERFGRASLAEAMFLTGARDIESAGGATLPAGASTASADDSLRAALRPFAARARTTAWMTSYDGRDAAENPALTLRFEFEDRASRCVGLRRQATFDREGSSDSDHDRSAAAG
jgi:hypothetical protein